MRNLELIAIELILAAVTIQPRLSANAADLSPYEVNRTADSDELSIYVIRQNCPLNWDGPSDVLKSTLHSRYNLCPDPAAKLPKVTDPQRGVYEDYATNHPLGHAMVSIRCKGEKEIYTGMTTTGTGAFQATLDVFLRGKSMGVLLETEGGKLQKGADVDYDIAGHQHDAGGIAEARFKIRHDQCEALKAYFSQYIDMGGGKKFGSLIDDPLKGQGAGCAPFGASMLRVLGLIPRDLSQLRQDSFANDWRTTIQIGDQYIGDDHERAQIGVFDLLFNDYKDWTVPGKGSRTVTFWDTEKMYDWMVAASQGDKHISLITQDGKDRVAPQKVPQVAFTAGVTHAVQFDISHLPIMLETPWQTSSTNDPNPCPDGTRQSDATPKPPAGLIYDVNAGLGGLF